MMNLRSAAWSSFLLALVLYAAVPADAQDAKKLHDQANSETSQEKQVQLLCKAADLESKNKEYRKDCDMARNALITSDKQALKTALDAADSQQTAKAKRYAKYVSSLDPDTHRQAEQLLARLNAGDAPPPTTTPVVPPPQQNQSGALLAQALTAYDSGNLQAAKTAAQGVTDPAVKGAASRILADIDRYNGYVSAGRQHEQAKEYADAERSYQAAFDLNGHVSGDDLAGKTRNMHQLASAPHAPVTVAKVEPPKTTVPKAPATTPPVSPEERKKQLLSESALAMNRNDLDTAGRKFKQVLDLDPSNEDAKRGLATITAQLSKDPVRLEKTLREAITAFYTSNFEDATARLNRYLGADGGKKKGAAYFYLGATEATLSFLDDPSRRASLAKAAQDDFKQARSAGYQPVEKYVSGRVLAVWKSSGS